jgi:hypothetical protein
VISLKDRGCLPCRARGGTDIPLFIFRSPTLLLPRSLILAEVLVVVTGARVALAPSLATPIGALAAVTTTWILGGRENVAARHLICSGRERSFVTCKLPVDGRREPELFTHWSLTRTFDWRG